MVDCKDPAYMMFGNEVRINHIMIHLFHMMRIPHIAFIQVI